MKQEQVYLLEPEQFRHYWPDIRNAIRRIPQYDEQFADEEMFEAAVKGALQFWVLSDGAIQCILITEIRSNRKGKVLRFLGAVGQAWDVFHPSLESILDRVCIGLGCERIEVVAARRGWSRKLRDMGFRFSHEILVRDAKREKEN